MIVDLFLVGKDPNKYSQKIDIDRGDDFETLKFKVARRFNIVVPSGIDFQDQAGSQLLDIEDVLDCPDAVGILVDGHSIREPVSYASHKELSRTLTQLLNTVWAKGATVCWCLLRGFPGPCWQPRANVSQVRRRHKIYHVWPRQLFDPRPEGGGGSFGRKSFLHQGNI